MINGNLRISVFTLSVVVVSPLWKIVLQFIKNVNIHILQDPTISLPSIYLREIKSYIHAENYYSQTFIVAFLYKP